MRVAILGRTSWLLDAAASLAAAGHTIGLVATSKSAVHDPVQPSDFLALAERFRVPFLRTNDLDSPQAVAALKDAGCDIGLSINWNRILSAAIGTMPQGILNVHAGDLPRYRGNAPVNWAILNGERHIGLCLHRMLPEIVDDGEVLARLRFPLTDQTYVGDVFGWLDRAIPELVVAGIGRLEAKSPASAESVLDTPIEPLRCFPRRPDDSRIDWSQPAQVVHRLVRASSEPFAGAYTTLEGRDRVRIWRAEILKQHEALMAVPGQVLSRLDGCPIIACGEDALILRRASVENLDGDALLGDGALAVIGQSLRNRLV